MKKIIALFLVLFFLPSCAHVISEGLREEAVKEIPFSEIVKNPDAHKGKTVIVGGEIINSRNLKEGTEIEVLQKPLDSQGRPKEVDISEGRFLIFNIGYLDTAIYSRGRKITVAGTIKGKKTLHLGEIEYTYPVIEPKELHLWGKSVERYYIYPEPLWHLYWSSYWYYPYWWRPYHN
ncbi:MAG: Slp family lipoprotein [Nitrospirota bacterium]